MMSLQPVFSNSHQPFYFARYRAHVTIGTYVKYHSGSSSYVGRILEVRGPQIVVNRFVRRQKLSHPELIVAGSITSESCRYMTEVFQTSGMDLVGSSDVSDISFVFKETDIEAGGGRMDMCQGVSNAYVIRYKENGEAIPANECMAFACDYQSFLESHDFCYAYHLWTCLLRINTGINRILGRHKEDQSSRMRVKVGMDSICWRYFLEKGNEVGCRGVQSVSLLCMKRITLPGLTIKRRVGHLKSDLLRFETESDLIGLAGLLGERVLVNVRAKPPFSRLENGRDIKENDTVNVVNGGETRPNVFRYRVDSDGVDLIFDGIDSLTISVRYSAYQLDGGPHLTDMAKRVILRSRPRSVMEGGVEEEKEEEEEEEEDIQVYLNEDFEHEGSFYRVSRIENNRIFARLIQVSNPTEAMRARYVGDEEEFANITYVIDKINERY